MKTFLQHLRDAALLRGATLARIAERPDAFAHGLLVMVVVAMLVGLPFFVQDVLAGFRPAAAVEPSDRQPDVSGSLDLVRPYLRDAGLPETVIDQFLQLADGNATLAGTVATEISALPTALPRPLAQAFIALGRWVSRPFANSPLPLAVATLSTWLGYGLWVMLAAKLLGGRGSLHGFFGATGFFAVPHVLNMLHLVPVVGTVAGVIAFLWGLAIYVVATAASQRLSGGRALVAVFAPFILLLTIVALLLVVAALGGLFASLGSMR